jgi:hypothetical protein
MLTATSSDHRSGCFASSRRWYAMINRLGTDTALAFESAFSGSVVDNDEGCSSGAFFQTHLELSSGNLPTRVGA